MYVADVEVTPKGSDALDVFAIGDLHADAKSFREDRCKAWIDHIASRGRGAIAVCVGDYVNGQTPGHKHFNPEATRPDYLTNMDGYAKHALAHCERLLKPLQKAKVPTVFVQGNHDLMLHFVGFTPMLCDRIGGTYLGDAGLIRVRSKSTNAKSPTTGAFSTTIYAHHGAKGGTNPGPKVNAMQALLGWVDADIYIAGHVHDADLRIVNRIGLQTRGPSLEVREYPVALYRAPSFLSRAPLGHSIYADRKEYGISDNGLMWVTRNGSSGAMQRHELLCAA